MSTKTIIAIQLLMFLATPAVAQDQGACAGVLEWERHAQWISGQVDKLQPQLDWRLARGAALRVEDSNGFAAVFDGWADGLADIIHPEIVQELSDQRIAYLRAVATALRARVPISTDENVTKYRKEAEQARSELATRCPEEMRAALTKPARIPKE